MFSIRLKRTEPFCSWACTIDVLNADERFDSSMWALMASRRLATPLSALPTSSYIHGSVYASLMLAAIYVPIYVQVHRSSSRGEPKKTWSLLSVRCKSAVPAPACLTPSLHVQCLATACPQSQSIEHTESRARPLPSRAYCPLSRRASSAFGPLSRARCPGCGRGA